MSDYWSKRFEMLEEASHNYGKKTAEEVRGGFVKARIETNKEISRWMTRLAANNEVSLSEARKLLDADELEEFHWDVAKYIAVGSDNKMAEKFAKELENASAKWHISRLQALDMNIAAIANAAYSGELDAVTDMAGDVYESTYYHTCYELQKGIGIGFDIGTVDDRTIQKLITKPWTADRRTFSDRIWSQKNMMIDSLHKELVRTIATGDSPDAAIKHMTKFVSGKYKNAEYASMRLVQTEESYFSSQATLDGYKEIGVEEYEILATLDSHTSEICQNMDGKHFPLPQYEVGATAPPFHPNCRTTTVPYFDDEFTEGEMRAARNEGGDTYEVPASMKYPEWKKAFVDGDKEGLTEQENAHNIGSVKSNNDLENQRYGRNKDTAINHSYINSGEYRRKFDKMSDDPGVVRELYKRAKEMLDHRSGTEYEDMYWIDSKTGDVVASELNMDVEHKIVYSDATKKAIEGREDLITLHTHPSSHPPSAADFNSNLDNSYHGSYALCHDGTIYGYKSEQTVSEKLYDMYTEEIMEEKKISEKEAQKEAIAKLKENHNIDYWEVKP